jgi:hypothetical protein
MSVITDQLLRDLHPAELTMPDGQHHTGVRVFITTRRLIAYQMTGTGMTRIADLELADNQVSYSRHQLKAGENLVVAISDGDVFVNRGRGCGCGSPLKALGRPAAWAH